MFLTKKHQLENTLNIGNHIFLWIEKSYDKVMEYIVKIPYIG
jgi:hypothetical protein